MKQSDDFHSNFLSGALRAFRKGLGGTSNGCLLHDGQGILVHARKAVLLPSSPDCDPPLQRLTETAVDRGPGDAAEPPHLPRRLLVIPLQIHSKSLCHGVATIGCLLNSACRAV